MNAYVPILVLGALAAAFVVFSVVAAAIIARNPPKRPELKFLIKNSPCFIGVSKDQPALLAKVNAIVEAAKKDGSLEAISQKWLKTGLPADL